MLLQQRLILGDLDHHQRRGIGQRGQGVLQGDLCGIQPVLRQIGQGGPLADMGVAHADRAMAVQIGGQGAEAVVHDDDGAILLERLLGQGVDQVLVRRIPGLQGILALPWVAIQGQTTMGSVEQGLHKKESNVLLIDDARPHRVARQAGKVALF
ncbi:hypothetical protein D3C75_866780 [compost metagenome]